jgi:hypothetical protein
MTAFFPLLFTFFIHILLPIYLKTPTLFPSLLFRLSLALLLLCNPKAHYPIHTNSPDKSNQSAQTKCGTDLC